MIWFKLILTLVQECVHYPIYTCIDYLGLIYQTVNLQLLWYKVLKRKHALLPTTMPIFTSTVTKELNLLFLHYSKNFEYSSENFQKCKIYHNIHTSNKTCFNSFSNDNLHSCHSKRINACENEVSLPWSYKNSQTKRRCIIKEQ